MEGQGMTKSKGRAAYEWIIIVILIVASLAVGFGIYHAKDKAQKGELMVSELEQLRAVIQLYKLVNQNNPPDLTTLTKMKYAFAPTEQPKSYLSNIKAGKDGRLVDPFGNPYKYDPKEAWVYSSTNGYASW